MKVKLTRQLIRSTGGTLEAGDELDVDQQSARNMIAQGIAEEIPYETAEAHLVPRKRGRPRKEPEESPDENG